MRVQRHSNAPMIRKEYTAAANPIYFKDLVSKVVVTPDTPQDMIKTLVDVGIRDVQTEISKRVWAPNPHMEAYQTRKERKKRERELGV